MRVLFLVLIVLFSVSCTEKTPPYSGEFSKSKTTVQIIKNIDSGAYVSVVDQQRIYSVKNGVVNYEGVVTGEKNNILTIESGLLILFCGISIIVGLIFGLSTKNSD